MQLFTLLSYGCLSHSLAKHKMKLYDFGMTSISELFYMKINSIEVLSQDQNMEMQAMVHTGDDVLGISFNYAR